MASHRTLFRTSGTNSQTRGTRQIVSTNRIPRPSGCHCNMTEEIAEQWFVYAAVAASNPYINKTDEKMVTMLWLAGLLTKEMVTEPGPYQMIALVEC